MPKTIYPHHQKVIPSAPGDDRQCGMRGKIMDRKQNYVLFYQGIPWLTSNQITPPTPEKLSYKHIQIPEL